MASNFSIVIEAYKYKPDAARKSAWTPPTPPASRTSTPARNVKRESRSTAPGPAERRVLNVDEGAAASSEEDVKPPTPRSLKRKRVPIESDDESDEGSVGYTPSNATVSSGTESEGEDESDASPSKKRIAKSPAPRTSLDKKPSPAKKKQVSLKYAAPEVYAHIKGLTDQLKYHNVLWACGINPGKKSGETGHAYASSSNNFWKAIAEAGLTSKREHPRASADGTMCAAYDIGMTNLVDRVTKQETELNDKEKREAVPALLAKIQHFHPRMVTFIGKSIFDIILQVLLPHARYVQSGRRFNDGKKASLESLRKTLAPKPQGVKDRSGLSPLRLKHGNGDITLLYVQFSTSGLCRDAQFPDQVAIFKDVKVLVDALNAGKENRVTDRHAASAWLEVEVDAFLKSSPPSAVPASVQAVLDLAASEQGAVISRGAIKKEE